MPGSTTPPPPLVVDHADMMAFAKDVEDSILVTMDFEGVDHLQAEKGQPQPSNYVKMSEVGIAVYDPRDKSANTNQIQVDDLGAQIRARHTIIQMYRRYTEETCPAFYHRGAYRNPSKAHHARPYHCKFARSIFRTAEEAMRDIKQLVGELLHQNRTMSEVQDGVEREICVLFWAAGMEEDILREAGIDLVGMSSRIKVWDMQIWSVFQLRFTKNQTKGETAFTSLGTLGNGAQLHNATNDTVAQMLSLLKLLHMDEQDWQAWHVDRRDLPAIPMAWVDPSIYRHNFDSRPKTLLNLDRAYNSNRHLSGTRSYKAHDHAQVKRNENATLIPQQSEVARFWANYDNSKVASTMSKYRKPAAKATSESKDFSGWPAGV